MVNLENKVIYDNLRNLEKKNKRKSILILVIIAAVTILGIYNIAEINRQVKLNEGEQRYEVKPSEESIFLIKSINRDEWVNILIAVNTPLFILMVFFYYKGYKYGREADKYCPYCYTFGFTTTTLNTTKIRSYIKNEKYKDSNGRERIKRVLYEDWEGQYRNECCGKVYNKTWQEKIDLG